MIGYCQFTVYGLRGTVLSTTALVVRTDRDRFVALAFCWADLLFEVDPQMKIAFAAGPTEAFFRKSTRQLAGTSFEELLAPPARRGLGQALARAVRHGRFDNETVVIGRPGGGTLAMSVSGYWLHGPGSNLYLGMRRAAPEAGGPAYRTQSGLPDARTFSGLAAERIKSLQKVGTQTEITLLVLAELEQLYERLDDASRIRLRRKVTAALKAGSLDGEAVAEVADGRYSVLRQARSGIDSLAAQLEDITRSIDPFGAGVTVDTTSIGMEPAMAVSQKHLAKGLLYAMNRFRDTRGKDFNIGSLSANIGELCRTAVKEVSGFRQLLAGAEFDLAVQPIVDVHSGEILHYEALCRFRNVPAMESPYGTISFAEETEMIHDFDLAMVEKTLTWLAAPAANSRRLSVAVNISGHSIGIPAFAAALQRMLTENAWSRGRLVFEITESARIRDLTSANCFVQALRQNGHLVALDDFGAGAASFQYLSSIEVDLVKLDGTALRHAEQAPKGRAFLSALTELCKRLNVKTIAEMVDTPERLKFCRDCGCNYVQGYLFGRPAPDVKSFAPLPSAHLFRARHWGDGGSWF